VKTKRSIVSSIKVIKHNKIEASIVGRIWFETGVISNGEWVKLTRDHEVPDASHAIRVESEGTGEPVGYIERHLSEILSPFIDTERIRLTGKVDHGAEDRITPVTIFINGEDEDVETVMNEVRAKLGEPNENEDSGTESLTHPTEDRNLRNEINQLQRDVEEIKRNVAQIPQQIQTIFNSMVAGLQPRHLQNQQVQTAQQQSYQEFNQVSAQVATHAPQLQIQPILQQSQFLGDPVPSSSQTSGVNVSQTDNTNIVTFNIDEFADLLDQSTAQTSSTSSQDSACSIQPQQLQQQQEQSVRPSNNTEEAGGGKIRNLKLLPEKYRRHFIRVENNQSKSLKVECLHVHCQKQLSLGASPPNNPTYGNLKKHLKNAHNITLK